jgi:hypothetical protein
MSACASGSIAKKVPGPQAGSRAQRPYHDMFETSVAQTHSAVPCETVRGSRGPAVSWISRNLQHLHHLVQVRSVGCGCRLSEDSRASPLPPSRFLLGDAPSAAGNGSALDAIAEVLCAKIASVHTPLRCSEHASEVCMFTMLDAAAWHSALRVAAGLRHPAATPC